MSEHHSERLTKQFQLDRLNEELEELSEKLIRYLVIIDSIKEDIISREKEITKLREELKGERDRL